MHLQGIPIEDIARELGVKKEVVISTLANPKVQTYIGNSLNVEGFTSRVNRTKLVDRIIEGKLRQIEETGDYGSLTEEDLMKLLEYQRKENPLPQDKGPSTAVQVVNHIDSFTKDLQNIKEQKTVNAK